MNGTQEGFRAYEYILFAAAAILTAVICVCLGSVNVPLKSTAEIFRRAILGLDMPKELPASIILTVRLPRVLCVALTGASLSLCGAAMQGLLKNLRRKPRRGYCHCVWHIVPFAPVRRHDGYGNTVCVHIAFDNSWPCIQA